MSRTVRNISKLPAMNHKLSVLAVACFWIVPAFLCTALTLSAQGNDRAKTQKTVSDYFMLLPEKYFEANRDQRLHWMLDPKRGAIVDDKNGYIYAPGDGAQTDIYLRLFKRSHMDPVVVVNYNNENGVFEPFLDFYVYHDGQLTNQTKKVMAVPFYEDLYYHLPRVGTAIMVSDKTGKKLYELVWSGNVFKRKQRKR
jgi:hypothetical protein